MNQRQLDEQQLRQKLTALGQSHVLRFFDQLDDAGKKNLIGQLAALDLDSIAELAESHLRNKPDVVLPKKIEPARAYPRVPDAPEQRKLYGEAEARGNELLQAGKIGAFLVAGGQGTRLGYDGPKGEFPITPVKNKPLFQVFAEQLLAHSRDSGKPIAWYIMTSDINDGPTRDFFKKHDHFGLDPKNIVFFRSEEHTSELQS